MLLPIRKRVREFLGIERLGDALERLENRAAVIRDALQAQPKTFVCVMVRARTPEGRQVTFGASGDEPREVINLRPDFPLREVEIVVFCDVRRVYVDGIYIGTTHVHGTLGECPSGYFEDWPFGVIGRVQWGLR